MTHARRFEFHLFTETAPNVFQRRPWPDTLQTVTIDGDGDEARAEVVEVVEVADGEFETDRIVRGTEEVLRAIANPSTEYNLLVLRIAAGLGRPVTVSR